MSQGSRGWESWACIFPAQPPFRLFPKERISATAGEVVKEWMVTDLEEGTEPVTNKFKPASEGGLTVLYSRMKI